MLYRTRKILIGILACICFALLAAVVALGYTKNVQPVYAASETDHSDHSGWTPISGSISYSSDFSSTTSGKYYLTQDITQTSSIEIGSSSSTPEVEITLCLNGYKIAFEYTSTRTSRRIDVYENATFILCDCNGSNGEHDYYADETGLYVFNNGQDGWQDSYNSAEKKGTVSGGVVTGGYSSSSDDGGGVKVESSSTFTMNGGTIAGNRSGEDGGGVNIATSSTFTMNGGTIAGNTAARNGGGVYFNGSTDGAFNMNGGTIADNTAAKNGGAVTVNSGTFNMNEGTITDNTAADDGGGMYLHGTFNMLGGTVSGNTAADWGGGIYALSVTLNISAGNISGNTAANQGGGVYIASGSTINLSGSTQITGNTVSSSSNNVYLVRNKVINLTGAFTGEIGITAATAPTASSDVTITSGYSTYGMDGTFTSDNNSYEITLSPNEDTSGSEIALALHVHSYTDKVTTEATCESEGVRTYTCLDCGDSYTEKIDMLGHRYGTPTWTWTTGNTSATASATCSVCNDENKETVTPSFDSSTGKLTATATVGGVSSQDEKTIAATVTLSDTTYYYTTFAAAWSAATGASTSAESRATVTLYADVGAAEYTAAAGSSCLSVTRGNYITLDLNGHTIDRELTETTATSDGYVIKVLGNLIINDSSGNNSGKITGGYNSGDYSGGIYVVGGTLTLNGGSITGNTVTGTYGGGGVYVFNDGTFEMNGGVISYNTATQSQYGGGGVNAGSGSFTMNGGTISNNTAYYGGGIRAGAFTNLLKITGGTITNNTATSHGGGVYVFSGTIYLSGSAQITGNVKSDGTANNVYLESGKVITLTDIFTGSVGLTTYTKPTVGSDVMVTSGYSNYGTGGTFTSDNDSYVIIKSNNELALHVHSYTSTIGGETKTYTCPVCDETKTASLASVVAVFESDGTIYTSTSLDDLKQHLTVTLVWDDNTKDNIDNGYALSGTLQAGNSNITVTYESKTTTFTVNAIAVVAQKLEITSQPTKTEYTALESFSADGMIVTLTYNDGTQETIIDYTVSIDGQDGLVLLYGTDGSVAVAVSYAGLTDTLTVSVRKIKVNVPVAVNNLVYNGSEQTGVAENDLYSIKNGSATNVGNYTAVVTLIDTGNYEWAGAFDGTIAWSIAKATLTVTADDKTVTYGDDAPTYTLTYSGFVNGENESVLTTKPEARCGYTATTPVSSSGMVIAVSGGEAINYTFKYVNGTLTIEKAAYDMSNAAWNYSDAFTYDREEKSVFLTGLPDGVTVQYNGTFKSTNADESGYTATVAFVYDSANYYLSGLPQGIESLTWYIHKATYDMSGVTFNDDTVTYDGQSHSLFVAGTLPAGVNAVYQNNGQINADSYTVTAVFAGDSINYNAIANMTATLTIKKAALTITANSHSITYGDAPANGGVSYAGFVNGESETALGGTLTYSYSYERYGNVGSYTITPGGYASGNYEIKYENGTLTVTAKDIAGADVTLGASLIYNGAAQEQTVFSVTIDGMTVAYTVSGNTATDAGTYILTITGTGNFTGAATEQWSIAKAKVTAPAAVNNLVYDGTEQTGVAENEYYTVTGGKATTAGNHTATVALKDTKNYEWDDVFDGSVSWSIKKAAATAPSAPSVTSELTYGQSLSELSLTSGWSWTDDTVKPAVADSGVTVYYVTIGVDDNNYDWSEIDGYADGYYTTTVTVTVNKAVYDMSGISFADVTFVEDGTAKNIYISGTLPAGVTVSYLNNGQTDGGIYIVTAVFGGDFDNYEGITVMTAQMVVNRASIAESAEGGNADTPDVIISEEGGTNPKVQLVVVKTKEVPSAIEADAARDELVSAVYDITLRSDGAEIQPSGTLTIRLLIPEDADGRTFRILHLHGDTVSEVEYTIDGKYAVFTVNSLSEFAFVIYNGGSALWLILVLAALLLAEIVLIALKKRKTKNKNKTYLAAGAFGGVIAIPEIVLLAVLGAAVIVLGVYTAYLYFPKKKTAAALEDDAAEETGSNKSRVSADEYADTVNEIAAAVIPAAMPVIPVPLPTVPLTVPVRFNRSFTAKLILAEDDTKEYFAELVNYLLSFGNIKSRMSWKYLSFNRGRTCVAKLKMRGKTLWLFLALDPAEFAGSKYRGEDFSQSTGYAKVPFAVKVKSPLGVKRAEELTYILMERLGVVRGEDVRLVSVADYPYDTQENLIARGLIKVYSYNDLPKGAELVSQGFKLRDSVSATEVNALMTDETAKQLLEESTEANAGKKSASAAKARVRGNLRATVNIDTLSAHYEANETVTLESLKENKLIPLKAEYVKILARGILNKPLTVEANDFSIDAVKMIVLVGGKAKAL